MTLLSEAFPHFFTYRQGFKIVRNPSSCCMEFIQLTKKKVYCRILVTETDSLHCFKEMKINVHGFNRQKHKVALHHDSVSSARSVQTLWQDLILHAEEADTPFLSCLLIALVLSEPYNFFPSHSTVD